MAASKITISPKTKVGELLDNFPQLESVLLEMSPAFEKLKNPVLRKTVARVATLQQIAVVGGLKVDDIIKKLREASGQSDIFETSLNNEGMSEDPPQWFSLTKIVSFFDASPLINSGESPLSEILRQANLLKSDEIFELTSPFIPAPVIEILRGKGFKVYTVQMESFVKSYIIK
jgi:hypothetical protein